jgi:hypothetical protein
LASLVCGGYLLFFPRHLRYVIFDIKKRSDNSLRKTLAVSIPDSNIILLIRSAFVEDPGDYVVLQGPSVLQCSGVGFTKSVSMQEGGVEHDYLFGRIPPKLIFKINGKNHEFIIKPPLLGKKCGVTINGKTYYPKEGKELVLLINDHGGITEISSFEESFGLSSQTFFSKPVALVYYQPSDEQQKSSSTAQRAVNSPIRQHGMSF